MAVPAFVTTGVAGAAMVGAAVLFATTDASTPVASPAYKLTSNESDLLLFGNSLAGNNAKTAAPTAAATASAAGDFVREFIGNGTAAHPNGGLLIGNGYSYSAADAQCASASCNGGRGGLLMGNGGNGYN
ncbi:MAG: hypothetical protein HY239_11185, partial [Mycolicibacterium aromaticivorans]|nr:hypothetical protein [Mycolicibacterium aromaticivorans]